MGTVQATTRTFVLSDIEGSTVRWDRDDAAMAGALERHDQLLHEVAVAHGGEWVKHTGDGALLAFTSARGALEAAVAFQWAVAREDWSEVGGLRVRMAVHTGEAIPRGADYFGQTLNRVARLLEVAHPGQILLSLATEELVRDRLPTGVALRGLGRHPLADLRHPERIFQVDVHGLPTDFPPPRTTATPQVALPTFRTSFVGREDDQRELAATLEDHPLVTLTGPGGTGKTRLAVETSRYVADGFPDGVFFVDLAPITDGDQVARQTARAAGVVAGGFAGGPAQPVRDRLLGAIRDRRMLLVLDNCEHLLDAAADHVEDLLGASADLRVLATSREALRVEGEQVWPVASLSLPDGTEDVASLQLLLDRIRDMRPDFDVADDDRVHLAEICRRLDGLPLALELAAARLEHLSPADLASRLGDRLGLLATGRRRPERQQTLRATIDWSYDLLDGDEQTVLRQLSVFAGSVPLDAIEAVAGTDLARSTLEVVGRLVSRSLVVAELGGETRYRLLETIRLYGQEQLQAADETDEARRRHRDWYLAWLNSFPWDLRLLSPTVTRRLEQEYDNLRLALEWSAAQGDAEAVADLLMGISGVGFNNGHSDELDRWFEVARSGPLPPRASALLDALQGWLDLGRYSGDAASFDAIREVATRVYDRLQVGDPYRAFARFVQAVSYATRPDQPALMGEAAAHAAELAARAGAHWVQLGAMSFHAAARLYDDDPAGAAGIVQEAMRMPSWAPEHDGSNVRHVLAVALLLLGQHDDALAYALAVAEDSPITWRHFGLFDAALVHAARGDTRLARELMARSVETLESLRWQHPMAFGDCAIVLGAIAVQEERWEDAARLLAINGGNTSHPSLFVLWRHYRDRVREVLPKDIRRRCIEDGRRLDARKAVEREIAGRSGRVPASNRL